MPAMPLFTLCNVYLTQEMIMVLYEQT